MTRNLTLGSALNRRATLRWHLSPTIIEPVPDVTLLNVDSPSESGLAAHDIDGTPESICGYVDHRYSHDQVYKRSCIKSTSIFAVIDNQEVCRLHYVATFQDRMAEAIRRCNGNQSELARRVNARYALSISPQTIQYLANQKLAIPAQGSTLTPEIAAVTGLSAEWLASGHGPMEAAATARKVRGHSEVNVSLQSTKGMSKAERQKAAKEVGDIWAALPPELADEFKLAMERAAHKKRKTGS